MKIDIVTIFPNMFSEIFNWGIIKQARKKELIEVRVHDLRKWTHDKHKQVDDRPFGGGPGMILKPEPLFEAITELSKDKKAIVVFLTPQGETLNQEKAEDLSKNSHLILICGRYEGIDQRVRNKLIDEEISIGEYVLSGGEIPAMVLIDTVTRLIPGVIGNKSFNLNESFSDPTNRKKLDFPQYTRPFDYKGMKVPKILTSGNHKEIEKWRKENQLPRVNNPRYSQSQNKRLGR